MADPTKQSTEERLAALEAAVETIQRSLRMLGVPSDRRGKDQPHPKTAASTRPGARDEAEKPMRPGIRERLESPAPEPGFFATLLDRGPQFWISRVGIVLLLVGVAYLFKYAVDQGWLTPWIRVAFGLALGATLAAIGFRVQRRQRWFAQVTLGGAAATWYITGFAAFQLLQLVGLPIAYGFMVLVTIFTFWVSLQQEEPALAVLAAFGALGTPFLLYTEAGSVQGLMTYTCVVLLGTSGIYLRKGWKSLLWVTAVDAWLIVLLALEGTANSSDRMALQGGVIVIWLLFWLVPVTRELLAQRDPSGWPPAKWQIFGARERRRLQDDLSWLVVLTAVSAFFASASIWSVSADDSLWGAIAVAGGFVYGLAAGGLSRQRIGSSFTSAHTITAAALAAIGFVFLFENDLTIVLWALEAGVLHTLARHLASRETSSGDSIFPSLTSTAYLLSGIVGIWLLNRLVEGGLPETPILNARAAADAAVIALSLVSTKWVSPKAAPWFWLLAHVAVLAWLARELGALAGGDGLVTAAWGVYALGLLFFMKTARKVALATLFLAVGKLVLHDMSQVEPIWRILLFLSFGGVFLAISYYFTDLLSSTDKESEVTESNREP